MIQNFTIPKGEKPLYYSSTVENGQVIQHEGDPAHAVYKCVMNEISRRANLYHEWLAINFNPSHDNIGVVLDDVFAQTEQARRAFMDGERG